MMDVAAVRPKHFQHGDPDAALSLPLMAVLVTISLAAIGAVVAAGPGATREIGLIALGIALALYGTARVAKLLNLKPMTLHAYLLIGSITITTLGFYTLVYWRWAELRGSRLDVSTSLIEIGATILATAVIYDMGSATRRNLQRLQARI